MLVTDGVLHCARVAPERAAMVRGEATTTYGVLGARIEGVARGLRAELGGAEGRAVGLALDEGEELLAAFLGVVHGGGVAVPLSAAWPEGQRRRAIELCEAAAVIGGQATPGAADAGTFSLDAIERAGAVTTSGEPAGSPGPRAATDPFYVGFTSGSTGAPRGVVRSHEAWVQSFLAMTLEFGIGPGARVLVPGSLFFSFSLIAALHALFVGATVVLPERRGARGLLAGLEAGCDAVYALPSMLREVLALHERRVTAGQGRAEGDPLALRQAQGGRGRVLRQAQDERKGEAQDERKGERAGGGEVGRIICAGEGLGSETRSLVARWWPGAALDEYYGASELGFVTLLGAADAEAHAGTVGRAFLGSEVAVLDDAGAEVEPGEAGLLCARTPYGGTHYLEGPGQWRDLDVALDHHGWRTVGDLARVDAEGYVTLVGRRDRMVVLRGENVYPEAVERVLEAQPGVARAAVLPQPAGRPTHLVAVVEGTDCAAHELLEACRAALPARAVPRRVVFTDALPVTATGKVDYAILERRMREGDPPGD